MYMKWADKREVRLQLSKYHRHDFTDVVRKENPRLVPQVVHDTNLGGEDRVDQMRKRQKYGTV